MAQIVEWLLLSVLSAVLWGAAMVVNKLVVGSYLRPLAFSFIAVVFDTVYIILLAILTGFRPAPLSSPYALAAVISGFIGVMGGLLSFFSFKNENASMVSAIIASGPLYTLILAVLFLGESPTPAQLLGIILIVAGTIAVSLKPRVSAAPPSSSKKRPIGRMIVPAVLAAFLFGSVAVFMKYSLSGMNFQESFITRQLGAVIALFPIGFLLLKNNNDNPRVLFPKKNKTARSLPFVGLAEIGVMGSVLLFTFAASLGPVSRVNAVISTMPLFVVLWMFLLRNRLPFANEEIKHENLKSLLFGTLLIVSGIYLVS